VSRYFAGSEEDRRVGRLSLFASDYIDIHRFFGADGVRPSDVRVLYFNEPFRLSDPLIGDFALKIAERMRSEGRIYDGAPVMKLASCDFGNTGPHITVQPCDYALQAGTCFALDLTDARFESVGGTLRDYYRRGCIVPTVANNPLAICLGVCGMLIVDERGERYMLRAERSRHLASLEASGGPSVAGVVDFVTGYGNLAELVESAMGNEIEEELGLHPGDYEIIPLAWATELFRGERPQIFCLIRTLLDREGIMARLNAIPKENREFESVRFLPLYGGTMLNQNDLDTLNFEAQMNFFLAEEYLSL
jgi:8-oxo-dGTP pyrophosphatase MutT (NUDIX family)